MAFDGMVTKAICSELSGLVGARIDKIFQPDKNTILLGFYLAGKNYALTACIEAQNCRLHLTTHSKPNPQVAPNFCMVLRKNLIGLRLKNIITFDLERLVILEFEGFDEVDDLIGKKLVIELMGKHSNFILLNESNHIIDCARHIKEEKENFRDVLPHIHYQFPSCNKKNFLDCTHFEDFVLLLPDSLTRKNLSTLIADIFNGFSRNFVESCLLRLQIQEISSTSLRKLYDEFQSFLSSLETNQLYFEEMEIQKGKKKDYVLVLKENLKPFGLNFFLDNYYHLKETSETFTNYRNSILKLILAILQKYRKRLQNINQKLKECENMETYRVYGELITANLYRISSQNQSQVELENYYDDNQKIVIPLDEKYSPSYNAKKYFKKYHKLKNALTIVGEQKKETLAELNYLESIIYELENCTTLSEVSLIFEEISENVIFKENHSSFSGHKKSKVKKSKMTKNKTVSFNPIQYIIDGYTVFVGRNNRENDYLTLKLAQKNDLWFHTKEIHGSHVILKVSDQSSKLDPDLLIKVAQLAAYHSKAMHSSNVPVDFCEVKQVKKPSGSKPGMVIYHHYETLNVNPADFK